MHRARPARATGPGTIVALLVALALVAAGCGGAAEPDATGGDQDAETADTAETPEQEEQDVAATGPTATCDDDSGDVDARVFGDPDPRVEDEKFTGSVPDHADLQSVELTRAEDSLLFRYELGGPPPSDTEDADTFPFVSAWFRAWVDRARTYTVQATPPSGVVAEQYEQSDAGTNSEVVELSEATVTVEDSQISVSVPLSELPEMADEFSWHAWIATSQEGEYAPDTAYTTDDCPNFKQAERDSLNRLFEPPRRILNKLPTQP